MKGSVKGYVCTYVCTHTSIISCTAYAPTIVKHWSIHNTYIYFIYITKLLLLIRNSSIIMPQTHPFTCCTRFPKDNIPLFWGTNWNIVQYEPLFWQQLHEWLHTIYICMYVCMYICTCSDMWYGLGSHRWHGLAWHAGLGQCQNRRRKQLSNAVQGRLKLRGRQNKFHTSVCVCVCVYCY